MILVFAFVAVVVLAASGPVGGLAWARARRAATQPSWAYGRARTALLIHTRVRRQRTHERTRP